MFDEISQSTMVESTIGMSSIHLNPNEKIAIRSYSNDIHLWLEEIPNKRLISFIYLPFRKMRWDVMVIYQPTHDQ
jgi:hypothetical protein